ncbi:hydrolase Nlp/P60 [Paenibacillus protaetiae]|uniref:Hydrolase Nlp/P60 n=2 Tax=Paenibacillus protaetiae TaxID=2509456 RepID=A0A4P6F1R8_9BACL|nr:hydrolase Nlp/P60 [Paenibacillus protaetiae]
MKRKAITLGLAATLLLSTAAAAIPAEAASQTAKVVYGVNFRTAPSSSASVIRMLKKGETLTIIDKVNSSWYQAVDQNGATGYLSTSSQYTAITSSPASSSGTTATIKKSVSFRTGPSTSSSVMRYLKAGEVVQVLSQPNSYWYQIADSSGKTGYVSTQAQYITLGGTLGNSSGSGNGSSSSGNGSSGGSATASAKAEAVIAAGMKYLGTPYEYGSSRSNTATFDCSDFVRQSFIDALGLTLPADSASQGAYVKSKGHAVTDWHQLKRGDLMFFGDYKGTSKSSYANVNKATAKVSHDGIYLGDGKILHTYSVESGGVTISSIAGTHWEYRFLYGGSPL